MLSRPNRLTSREVEELFKGRAQTAHATNFSVRARREATAESPRATVVAGAKIFKSAVSRARVKRRLRHALGSIIPQCAPGVKIVVMAKEPALKMDFKELTKELTRILKVLVLIK